MFKEYDIVVSTKRLSSLVASGCKGTILMFYENEDYEVEFMDNDESLGTLTVSASDLALVTIK